MTRTKLDKIKLKSINNFPHFGCIQQISPREH